jgi:nitrite reductase/ring-hydroxylating ferredoxin subunit
MGADLAQGRYDPKTRQLHCPWHGYVYDAGTGVMTENPNVEIMRSIRIASATFNPDKAICYRLRRFTVTRDGDHWVIASPESAP